MINSPPHYLLNETGIECIEAIQASMPLQEFRGYCKGNAQKYIWRYSTKNTTEPVVDLKKARWYLDRLITTFE